MRGVAQGGNLTESAHLAGFSSSAHLSFAFKQMFGLAASDILAMGVAIDVSDEAVQWRETANRPGPRVVQQAGDLEPSI